MEMTREKKDSVNLKIEQLKSFRLNNREQTNLKKKFKGSRIFGTITKDPLFIPVIGVLERGKKEGKSEMSLTK